MTINIFGVNISCKEVRTYKISTLTKPNSYNRNEFADQITKDIPITSLDEDPSGLLYVYSFESYIYKIFKKCHKTIYIGETIVQKEGTSLNGTVTSGARFKHHILVDMQGKDCSGNYPLSYAYHNRYDIILTVYVLDKGSRKNIETKCLKNYREKYGHLPIGNSQL